MREALQSVSQYPNVFAKISDVVRRVDGRIREEPAFYRPALDTLLNLFGPDRIVYGSNWPVSERVAPYAIVHRVVADYFGTHSREIAERCFWRNSLAAYRWVRRGASASLR
jgi:predicted TIM-barrel fold metal-dependent hydrolase